MKKKKSPKELVIGLLSLLFGVLVVIGTLGIVFAPVDLEQSSSRMILSSFIGLVIFYFGYFSYKKSKSKKFIFYYNPIVLMLFGLSEPSTNLITFFSGKSLNLGLTLVLGFIGGVSLIINSVYLLNNKM